MLAAPHAAAATPTDDAPPFTIDTPWTIRIEPVLWYPGLRGDISFPGGGTSADNTFEVDEIDLDENEVTPAFRAEVRWDAWSLRFGGFVFNADDTGRATKAVEAGGLAIPRNAAVNYDLTYTSFETALGYRVLNRSLGDDPDDTTFHFDVYGGLRYYGIDLDLDTAAGTASGDGDWVEPIAGVRFELLFSRALSMELNSDFGLWDAGDNESSSWNIEVGFRWAMHDNVDVRLGFRHLSVDLTDGSGSDAFIFDNSLAGLTLSVGIRF
ncbi:MAG: hypothetical protein KDA21_00205 [Phycisphaerales bacterium]|nr:hypothetical protein [Phycisphaerales bacterium]